MSIISLADWHSLTGITDTTNDTFVTAQLSPVQDLIERYTDRHFDQNIYAKWDSSTFGRDILLDEYPATKILFIGTQVKIATLTWTTPTYDFAVEVKSDRITITNTKTYSFTSNDFLFSSYQTLNALKVKIEDDFDITVSIETGYSDLNTKLLKTGNGTTWYGAKRVEDANYRMQDDSLRYIKEEEVISANFYSDLFFTNSMYICYEAGYTSATMPQGLKLIMANMIRDLVNLKTLGGKTALKSEEITNYAYTNWGPGDYSLKSVVENYYGDLDFYKKKSI